MKEKHYGDTVKNPMTTGNFLLLPLSGPKRNDLTGSRTFWADIRGTGPGKDPANIPADNRD